MGTSVIYLVGNGSGTFIPPETATAVVDVWGGGQSGNDGSGNGGIGGGWARKNAFSLTKGTGVSFVLGAPGIGVHSGVGNGGDTWFGSAAVLQANGGGSTSTRAGDTTQPGGASGPAYFNNGLPGGGGAGGPGGPGGSGSAGKAGGGGGSNSAGGGGGAGGGTVGGSLPGLAGGAGGNGPAGTGGAGGATTGSPAGAKGGPGAGGGGGYAAVGGAGGNGGDDFDNGGGGGGADGYSNPGSAGGSGGTPGGGGTDTFFNPSSSTTIGQGGWSVIKISWTSATPATQTIIYGTFPGAGSATLNDSLAPSDSFSLTLVPSVFALSLAEKVTPTDHFGSAATLRSALSETAGAVDSLAPAATFAKALTETAAPSDSLSAALNPVPTIATPLFALDMSAPLSDNGFFPNNGGANNGGGTPISSLPAVIGSVTDLAKPGQSWWDILNTAPMTGTLQNGMPGLEITSHNNCPYLFVGDEDALNNIYVLQGAPGGVPSGTPAPFTVLSIFKFTTLPTGSTPARLFSATDFGGTTFAGLSVYTTSTGFYFERGGSTVATPLAVTTTLALDTLYVVVATFSGFGASDPMTLTVNALPTATTNPTGTMETGPWTVGGLMSAGYNGSAQDPTICDFFESRVWGSAATSGQVAQLIAYGTGKWAGMPALALSETAPATDHLDLVVRMAGTLSEQAAATDHLAPVVGMAGTLSETVIATDHLAAAAVFAMALSDKLSPTDSYTSTSAGAFALALSERLSPTDQMAPTAGLAHGLSETASATDTLAPAASFAHALADTAAASDALVVAPFKLSMSDTRSISDSLAPSVHVAIALSESAPAADHFEQTTTGIFALSWSDTLTVSDRFAPGMAIAPLEMVETLSPSDTFAGHAVFAGHLADDLDADDEIGIPGLSNST